MATEDVSIPEIIPLQICTGPCKQTFPHTEENFIFSGGYLGRQCRDCTKEKMRIYHQKNKERLNEKSREYREDHKDELREKGKDYYKNNKDKILAYQRENNKKDKRRDQQRRSQLKNKEKVSERQKKYRENHSDELLEYQRKYGVENKDRIRERTIEYRENNKDKLKHNQSLYYEENKEELREKSKEWRRKNKEKILENNRKRLLKKKNVVIQDLTKEEWEFIKKSHNYCCAYCGKKQKKLTKDHITPISLGGNDTASNIVPACRSCNSKKYTGPPLVAVQPMLPLKIQGTL